MSNIMLRQAPRGFLILAAFVVAAFLFGGSSRADVTSLLLLRPIALLLGLWAWASMTPHDQRDAKPVLWLFVASAALVALHLVPVPPSIWGGWSGRDFALKAAASVGTADQWRPFTLLPHMGWNALFAWTVPIGAYLVMTYADRSAGARIVNVLAMLLLFSGVLGVLQMLGRSGSLLYFYRISSGEMVGLFANRNHDALFMAAGIPLLAAWASLSGSNERTAMMRRNIALMGAMTLLVLIVVTGSRGGVVLGLIGMAGAFLVYKAPTVVEKRRHTEPKFQKLKIAALIIMPLALLILTYAAGRGNAFERLMDPQLAADMRGKALPTLLVAIKDFLPFGSGAGSFVPVYQHYEPTALLSSQYFNRAHDDPVEVALEYGIPGLLLIVAGVAMWLMAAVRIWPLLRAKKDRWGEDAILAVTGAIILFMFGIGSFVDYHLRVPSLSVLAVIAAVWMARGTYAGTSTHSMRKAER